MNPRLFAIHAAAVCALALVGCGGSSNSSDTTLATTSQVAKGTISGFGSVHVNGVEWHTDNASFMLDDAAGTEAELEVGHIVVVHGTISADGTAQAASIEYDAEIEGTISAKGNSSVTVVGLTIGVNADTIYDDDLAVQDLDGLMVGDYVEVSALTTADGYLATRIDVEIDDGEVEVYGEVVGLDSDNSKFMIYELVVDYSTASFDDFDGRMIAEGDYVEVEADGFNAMGELVATSVEHKDNNPYDDGDEGDEFEIEGYISVVNDDGSFEIDGVTFVLAPNVTFEHGSLAAISEDVKVEVEGEMDALGNLVVHEIEFKVESDIEVEAPVDAVGVNSITALGLTFTVADRTQYEDSSDLDETYFDLGDVMPGEWVEIKAFRDDVTGELIAVRIERDDMDDEVELEAPLDLLPQGDVLTLLGIRAIVNANTELDEESGFANVGELVASLTPGMVIEVEGAATTGSDGVVEIMINEIGLED